MMKGLMGRCLSNETALKCVRVKTNLMEDELNGLKAWRTSTEKKLACSKQDRVELEKQVESLRKVLEDKEKEIADTKNQLRQVKDEAVREYWDSDAFLSKLGESFAEGFDDALHQVKSSYPDLDVSHVSIDTQAQSTAQPVLSESIEDLFVEDVDNAAVALQGDRDVAPGGQEKVVEEGTCHPEDANVDDTPTV